MAQAPIYTSFPKRNSTGENTIVHKDASLNRMTFQTFIMALSEVANFVYNASIHSLAE